MRQCDVRTPQDALAYLVDCQLATVSSMAMKRRRPKYEYERQVSIAQLGLDWSCAMGCTCDVGARAYEARNAGGVASWAKQFMPNDQVEFKEGSAAE